MNCQQVQDMLAELRLPQVQAQKYATLHRHVQGCLPCQQVWTQWLDHEQQLAKVLAVESAPAGMWEAIMTQVEAHQEAGSAVAERPVIRIETSAQGVCRLVLHQADQEAVVTEDEPTTSPLEARTHRQLAEYLRGERSVFQLPVDLRQCSDFTQAVLAVISTIPYGEVRSYHWVAAQLGRPRATRAVGRALHSNPVPIVIPCHRVVKSDGSMGGYAFGPAWKTRLLALEQETVPFVGCTSTHILCYRGCRHEQRVQEGNRVHFSGVSEALDSGYRPCKTCQPV